MTPFRWALVAFWAFVVLGLYWQFHTYDSKLEADAEANPPKHYWGPLAPKYAPAPPPSVAKVQEAAYWVTPDQSGQMFTAHLTLKNVGGAKATAVTANISPFVNAQNFDDNGGHTSTTGFVSSDDAVAANSQWLSFPDLGPGESATETATFTARGDIPPSDDPHPKIVFATAK